MTTSGRSGIYPTMWRATCGPGRGGVLTATRGAAWTCGRGIRAMRALVYAVHGLGGLAGVRAPETIFDRVRSGGPGGAPRISRAMTPQAGTA